MPGSESAIKRPLADGRIGPRRKDIRAGLIRSASPNLC